jgi:hypothetical protein
MKKNKLYFFIILACFVGYGWLYFSLQHQYEIQNSEFSVCLFKNITNIPCPSCGTTRAVMEIYKGAFGKSVLLNPFGILVALIMLVCPIWIAYDYLSKKDSFYQFYIKSEKVLQRKKVYITLLILVLLNWIWNINKNL